MRSNRQPKRGTNRLTALLVLGVVVTATAIGGPALRAGSSRGPNRTFYGSNGTKTQVPEPASMACMIIGLAGVLRKAKK